MKAVDLAHAPAEVREAAEPATSDAGGPRYPYGTELHLDHETLAKVEGGNGALPAVGGDVQIAARGKVTGMHEDTQADGSVRRRATVQITHMGHQAAPDEGKTAKAMYPTASGE